MLQIIVVLIVVGVLLWLVNNYIPMDGKIKNILNVVVVILVVLWLLGLVTSYTLGGFIHALLVIAIIVVLVRIISGRSAV